MAELTFDPGRRLGRTFEPALAPAVAAILAVVALLLGAKGSDLPAALYRISLFHRHGLTLWDSQWYGGHWTLDYSVIFPPVAGILGVHLTEVAAVAVSALAFDKLAVGAFGRSARVGSIAFALGTLVQVAIGQLPFLMGEAFGLCRAVGGVARAPLGGRPPGGVRGAGQPAGRCVRRARGRGMAALGLAPAPPRARAGHRRGAAAGRRAGAAVPGPGCDAVPVQGLGVLARGRTRWPPRCCRAGRASCASRAGCTWSRSS